MIRYQIADRHLRGIPGHATHIQIRDKELEARALVEAVRRAQSLAPDAVLLVNTRVDVALACGARGAHLPSHSPPPSLWRRAVPRGFLFSVACHSTDDVMRAEQEGSDLALLSPIFDPLSKPAQGPALGLDVLGAACRAVKIPVVALGGITPDRILLCLEAGAAGVAGIALFETAEASRHPPRASTP